MEVRKYYTVIPFVNLWLEDTDGNMLIGQHPNLPNKPYPSFWDFPGGKIEDNESVYQALGRELKEETGFTLVSAKLHDVFHNYEDLVEGIYPGIGICFRIIYSGDFVPDEMLNMHWEKLENLKNYKFTPWAKYYLRDFL